VEIMPLDGQPAGSTGVGARGTPAPPHRLPRAQRRDQILASATRAFARTGFTATSLDDIATEAGVTRAVLYRHFDSKSDLYLSVLDKITTRLADIVGTRDYTVASIDALTRAAAEDPDGFKLLFRHAAREPEFRLETDRLRATSAAVAERELADAIPDPTWRAWAAQLAPVVAIEAVMAWLDAGRPDPDQITGRIHDAVHSVIEAAQPRP
jgi:AcrR family transcriptional regulator